MDNKLKKIIFKKLYEDLSGMEIIHHDGSIWFIDRGDKYWYFEYQNNGILYWRHNFFIDFFRIFSMKINEFEPIISEWVEEVLNCKVVTTNPDSRTCRDVVEEVLNCKVVTTVDYDDADVLQVEEVLNKHNV